MARRRGRGGLTDDDRALWGQVARSVTPMTAAARRRAVTRDADALPSGADASRLTAETSRAATPIPPDHALVPMRPPVQLPADFRIGQAARPRTPAPPSFPSQSDRLAAQAVQMDAGTHRKLTRGKLRPEARIDLHGMTLAVAKAELTGFILSAQASGRRLVLVITGKGKGDHGPLPTRSGALRHEVPHWLHMAPMAGVVMQVVPAHLRHGGGGAYYVYLRRSGRG